MFFSFLSRRGDLLQWDTNSCFLLYFLPVHPPFLLLLFFFLAVKKLSLWRTGGVTLLQLKAIHRSLKGDIYALSQSQSHTQCVGNLRLVKSFK